MYVSYIHVSLVVYVLPAKMCPQLLKFCDWVASSEADKRNLLSRVAQEVSATA